VPRSQDRLPQHFPFLDIVRTVATLLVMFGHVRWFYFEGIANVASPGVLTNAFYFVTGLHLEGVVLFFVISGFLVGGPLYQSMATGRFDAWRYVVNRFVRIYLVFIPALLLAAVLEEIARDALADTRVYKLILIEPWTAFDNICHLACLQGVFCGTTRNGPLWSLAYEWILYLSAPVFFAAWFAPLSKPLRALAGVFVTATVYTLLPGQMQWSWFAFWAMGIVAYQCLARGLVPWPLGLAGIAVVVAAFVLSRTKVAPPLATSCLLAVGLTLAIACREVISWNPAPRAFAALAAFSYSLYVTHLPVSKFTAEVLDRIGLAKEPALPGVAAYSAFVITALLALAVAATLARLTEANTSAVRRVILSR
jgi:peptidoglycan/LPS O-acetylase OafA/YrhL